MSERRRLIALMFVLALVLAPGLSLAAGQNLRTPAPEESPFERLFTWIERGWEALTGTAPLDAAVQRSGCGIDPNGGCVSPRLPAADGGH
jgi:hypothetical protein